MSGFEHVIVDARSLIAFATLIVVAVAAVFSVLNWLNGRGGWR